MPTEPCSPGALDLLEQAKRAHEELDAFVAEFLRHDRYPTRADQKRLRELRTRAGDLLAVADRLLLEEECTWRAVGERLGRDAIDGDSITEQDRARAAEILES